MIRALLTALLLVNLPLDATAKPTISVTTRHYIVQGDTPTEIRHQIQLKGPVGKNGRRFHAYTNWNISWEKNIPFAPTNKR